MYLLRREGKYSLDEQTVCKNMRCNVYNYSNKGDTTFTEAQVSLPEIYKTKLIPHSITGISYFLGGKKSAIESKCFENILSLRT